MNPRWTAVLPACMLIVSFGSAAHAQNRMAFRTSATGTANLATWPQATGTGVAAADAICQSLASSAGLANPTGFRAWISDGATDAYCHVQGFPGTKATNCGQPSLPSAAGPWVRTDGVPFAPTIDRLAGPLHAVYSALDRDENGNAAATFASFTATTTDGVRDGFTTCADWTAADSSPVGIGYRDRTTDSWTNHGSTQCTSDLSLICLESGVGPPLTGAWHAGRLAFVSSVWGPGNISYWLIAPGVGLDGIDAACQNIAAAAFLPDPESFRAWMSDSTADAASRFVHDGPWVRRDGILIGHNLADLTDGSLNAPINVTESGVYLGNAVAWTGTEFIGLGTPSNCDDWTNSTVGASGTAGIVNTATAQWTDTGQRTCNNGAFLYCLADTPAILLFFDNFEWGDTTAWSAAVP